jgi:hypothetical protein
MWGATELAQSSGMGLSGKKGSSETRVLLGYLCERDSQSFWTAKEEEVHGETPDRFRSCRYGSKLNWVKEGACFHVAVI